MTDLSERLEQDLAPAWRPDQEDADILIGQVISIEMGSSEYGSYPLLVVRQEDGTEKAVHAFHTVLRNELMKARPNVGETIGIKPSSLPGVRLTTKINGIRIFQVGPGQAVIVARDAAGNTATATCF